jgi:hypothetical protein
MRGGPSVVGLQADFSGRLPAIRAELAQPLKLPLQEFSARSLLRLPSISQE